MTTGSKPRPRVSAGLRVTILVLGVLAGLFMIQQVYMLASLASVFAPGSPLATASMLVAFAWIVALACVWAVPGVAALVFVLAALGAFVIGAGSIFRDMTVWGVVALVLALLCLVAWRRGRR
jgi:hypothetical protein